MNKALDELRRRAANLPASGEYDAGDLADIHALLVDLIDEMKRIDKAANFKEP